MRLSLLLFFIALFALQANDSYGQKTKISLNLVNVTVADALDEIETRTEFEFVFRTQDVDLERVVSLKITQKRINEVLDRLFSNTATRFEVDDRKVFLRKRLDPSDQSNSQEDIVIRGTISDTNGIPLAGVNVVLKGSDTGVASDFDGNYQITIPNTQSILVFSSIGFAPQEVPVGNQTTINIVLREAVNQLDQVVLVSSGYTQISKERATGSFEKINEDVIGPKVTQDIISRIEGEISGILFDDADGPTIRGISTINAVNDPLIVVDGFPIEQGIESINPNNVKSIDVLKDAAAASIWGIRAANGVIVIATKSGSKNSAPKIEVSSNYTFTQQLNLQDLSYASTSALLDLEQHTVENGWFSPSPTTPFNTGTLIRFDQNNGVITEQEANAALNPLRGIDSRQEFQDLFISDETWIQNNVAISGGGEKNSYRASLTYNRNENLQSFQNNDRQELLANLNNTIQISPKVSFRGSINYINTIDNPEGLSLLDVDELGQYQNILDTSGNELPQPRTIANALKEQTLEQGYPFDWNYNLNQEFRNKDNQSTSNQLRLQAALDYDITKDLTLSGLYQYEWGQTRLRNLFNEETYEVRNLVNTFTSVDFFTGELSSVIPRGSFITEGSATQQSQTGRIQLNFDKSLNNGLHEINALVGYEVRKVESEAFRTTKYGFDPRSLTSANINFNEIHPVSEPDFFGGLSGFRSLPDPTFFNSIENRFLSYYGNVAYTYDNRYSVSGSTRLDDANLFGASDEFRNIPLFSLGAKWNIHNENFFQSNFVDQLSLRATRGSNGNVDTSTSPFLQANITRNNNNNQPFSFISNPANPTLRLERTFVTNLGLDFALFNNRVGGSVEYYFRKSEDLLSDVEIQPTLGFDVARLNAGELENKGFDINLNAKVIKSDDFSYDTTINFSYNKNEVTRVTVPPSPDGLSLVTTTSPVLGRPLRSIFSFRNAGLDENGNPQTFNENGDILNVVGFIDDGNGGLTPGTIGVDGVDFNGTTTPEYYGGWVNKFTYKNVFLRVLTTFKFGHVFRNTDVLDYTTLLNSLNGHVHQDFERRWQNPGDENSTNIPAIPTNSSDLFQIGYFYYNFGNQFVDSASHIRLREVILNYDLGSKVANTIGFDRLNISLQARNLAIITFNRWDIDPESFITLDNGQSFALPNPPTYTLSISANF